MLIGLVVAKSLFAAVVHDLLPIGLVSTYTTIKCLCCSWCLVATRLDIQRKATKSGNYFETLIKCVFAWEFMLEVALKLCA